MADNLRTYFGPPSEKAFDRDARIKAQAEDPRYRDTKYLVEATDNEVMGIWSRYAKDSLYRWVGGGKDLRVVEWVQTSPGYIKEIGELAEMPVAISLHWVWCNRILVCFWELTSQVCDYRMAEKWLEEKFPGVPKSNSSNFGNSSDIFKGCW
jgi:hypothetical protein